MQTAIRCMMMRGGTSRGAYFLANDLPIGKTDIERVLAAGMGSPNAQQLDGIGGGTSITSKVAIVSTSDDDRADVDYLFAQVALDKASVDFSPSCGNILAGVAPFAIEAGLVRSRQGETVVRIKNINTNTYIEAIVQTPYGMVNYDGNTSIDGIAGTAAPIVLNFMNAIGSKTGKLFPTGSPKNIIQGIEVSCVDAAVPMVLISAKSLGKSGSEKKEELDEDFELLKKIESIRIEAGKLMGLGNVSDLVIPKVGILSKPRYGGSITSRYFVPRTCHASHAVTGAICVSVAALAQGSVAYDVAEYSDVIPVVIKIEHPSGSIDITQDYTIKNDQLEIKNSGVIRTARKLFSGELYISSYIWERPKIKNQ